MAGLWWRAALAAVLMVALVGCVSSAAEPSGSASDRIEAVVSQKDAPVAVPVDLPEGYAFAGYAGANRRGDEAVAASWLYAISSERETHPVHVCVLAAGADESACPASPGPDRIERRAGPYRVLVASASKEQSDLSPWEDLDFTADWPQVDWIDDPSVF